MLKIKMTFDLD